MYRKYIGNAWPRDRYFASNMTDIQYLHAPSAEIELRTPATKIIALMIVEIARKQSRRSTGRSI
jgi:hypothetical protein